MRFSNVRWITYQLHTNKTNSGAKMGAKQSVPVIVLQWCTSAVAVKRA